MNYIVINQFNEHSLRRFRQEINNLEQSSQPFIPIIIDSFGGDVYSLLGMVDLIENSTKQIATICDSKAMSAGATLLSCGSPGLRFASKRSTIMVHEVLSHGPSTKVSDVTIDTNHANHLNRQLFSILDKNSKKKSGYFYKLLGKNKNSNLYFSAEEAKKHGIIDHISVPILTSITQYSIEN